MSQAALKGLSKSVAAALPLCHRQTRRQGGLFHEGRCGSSESFRQGARQQHEPEWKAPFAIHDLSPVHAPHQGSGESSPFYRVLPRKGKSRRTIPHTLILAGGQNGDKE